MPRSSATLPKVLPGLSPNCDVQRPDLQSPLYVDPRRSIAQHDECPQWVDTRRSRITCDLLPRTSLQGGKGDIPWGKDRAENGARMSG